MPPLAVLDTVDPPVLLRRAVRAESRPVVELLAADQLGAGREADPRDPAQLDPYLRAVAAIDADPAQLLLVAGLSLRGSSS